MDIRAILAITSPVRISLKPGKQFKMLIVSAIDKAVSFVSYFKISQDFIVSRMLEIPCRYLHPADSALYV